MAALTAGSKRTFAVMNGGSTAVSSPFAQSQRISTPISSRASSPSNELQLGPSPAASDRTNSATPARPAARNIPSRTFDPDASIVLVGAKGTGKSTLGVIAATAFQRRLIETDFSFKESTGLSTSSFRKAHGALEYQKRALEVLERVLRNNASRCVIVCGLVSLSKDGQALLSEYGQTHPVIHILREVKSVQRYLNLLENNKVVELLEATEKMFRACSNLEFYNLSNSLIAVKPEVIENTVAIQRPPAPYLALKKAERHFLKFLALATKIANVPALEEAYPLSRFRVEMRPFTYAMSVPLSKLASVPLDTEKLEEGADVFEIRVDEASAWKLGENNANGSAQLRKVSEVFATIRRTTIVPILYHVELSSLSTGTVGLPSYLELVHHGLRLAPEFVTLDLSLTDDEICKAIRAKGSTRLIAHSSSDDRQLLDWDHEYWLSAYQRAQRLGFDLVRLCWPATTMEDNFLVHKFKAKAASLGSPKLPLIAYNTGQLGRTSCCFNPTMTPVTHEDLLPNRNHSECPLITATEATRALYSSFVFEPMRFYIMGASMGHSLSPAMHSAAYQRYGMPHTYQIHDSASLSELRTLIADPHFGGCSISLPFKLEVIALTHSISCHAKAIGAINTLIPVRRIHEDGSIPEGLDLLKERNRSGPVQALYGENTDWIGIRACVRRGLSPANAVSPRTSALVVGAGGMARATIYALIQLGVRNIFIHNRTAANADKLIAHFRRLLDDRDNSRPSSHILHLPTGSKIHMEQLSSLDQPWPGNFRQPTIVVSCIPTHRIGDNPVPHFTLPLQWLKSPTGGLVVEVAYRNIHTPLLDQIRAKAGEGWVTMDGLDLLPEQGFAQFEMFTGRHAPRQLMKAVVLRNYRDEQGRPDPDLIQWRLEQIKEQEP